MEDQLARSSKLVRTLVENIDELIESSDGSSLTIQAGKLAIQLEHILEYKAQAKRLKNSTYATSYEKQRRDYSQGDAKIYADADKDITYEHIESLESGIKSVLSTVKDRLKWLELENMNKKF